MAEQQANEHEDAGDAHGDHHGHPPGGVGKYLAVFGGLLVLTMISYAVARSPIMETPSVGWAGMMAISCCKALLVILFFMHLRWEANWKYVLTIPASIMSIFLLLMLIPDIGRRTQMYSEERWLHAAEPQAHREDEVHQEQSREAGADSEHHEPEKAFSH
jgi:cytochrome c oxidase subunit 4